MISASRVEEIRRLLSGGKLSQRAVARLTGLSRETVRAVAVERRRSESGSPVLELRDGFSPPSGLLVRCPGCGAKVRMPCLACFIQKTKSHRTNMVV